MVANTVQKNLPNLFPTGFPYDFLFPISRIVDMLYLNMMMFVMVIMMK